MDLEDNCSNRVLPIDQDSGSRLHFFVDDPITSGEATTGGRVHKLHMWAGMALAQSEIGELTDGGHGSGDGGGSGGADVLVAKVMVAKVMVAKVMVAKVVVAKIYSAKIMVGRL